MPDLAVVAPDTLFECNSGASSAYEEIALVKSIDDIDADEYMKVKTTHLQSTRMSSLPGLPEYQDMTLECLYSSALYTKSRALRGVTGKTFRLTLSNGDIFSIDGYIRSSKAQVPEADSEEPDSFTMVLAVNGITRTPVGP